MHDYHHLVCYLQPQICKRRSHSLLRNSLTSFRDIDGLNSGSLHHVERVPPVLDVESPNVPSIPNQVEVVELKTVEETPSQRPVHIRNQSVDSGFESENSKVEEENVSSATLVDEDKAAELSALSSAIFPMSPFSPGTFLSIMSDQAIREEKIKAIATLLQTLVSMGEYQLNGTAHRNFLLLLGELRGEKTLVRRDDTTRSDLAQIIDIIRGEQGLLRKPEVNQGSVRLKDAVGRKFMFPFQLCKTWEV